MAALEFTENTVPLQVKKEVTCKKTLSAGDSLEAEVGGDKLEETVPNGKQWVVILSVRVVETNV